MSAIDDIINWPRGGSAAGLPIVASWGVKGMKLDYHVGLIQAGHRFLPSIVHTPTDGAATYYTPYTTEVAYLETNGLPLCLRSDNLGDEIRSDDRPELIEANVDDYPVVVHYESDDSTLADESVICSFAPTSLFTANGALYDAAGRVFPALAADYTTPPWYMWLENNEGGYDSDTGYGDGDHPYVTANGTDAFGNTAFDIETELENENLRLDDDVAAETLLDPGYDATDLRIDFWIRRHAQLEAIYDSFEAEVPAGWANKMYRARYSGIQTDSTGAALSFDDFGYAPEIHGISDAGSPPIYMFGGAVDGILTSSKHLAWLNAIPAFEALEADNAKSWREFSLRYGAGSVMASTLYHDLLDHALWKGILKWVFVATRKRGIPFLFRYFPDQGNFTVSTFEMFTPAQQTTLTGLGRSDVAAYTEGDNIEAVCDLCDEIAEDADWRDFVLNGDTIVHPTLTHPFTDSSTATRAFPRDGDDDNRWTFLECSANTPRFNWAVNPQVGYPTSVTINVWASAILHDDGRILLYVFTPHPEASLAATFTVRVPGWGNKTVTTADLYTGGNDHSITYILLPEDATEGSTVSLEDDFTGANGTALGSRNNTPGDEWAWTSTLEGNITNVQIQSNAAQMTAANVCIMRPSESLSGVNQHIEANLTAGTNAVGLMARYSDDGSGYSGYLLYINSAGGLLVRKYVDVTTGWENPTTDLVSTTVTYSAGALATLEVSGTSPTTISVTYNGSAVDLNGGGAGTDYVDNSSPITTGNDVGVFLRNANTAIDNFVAEDIDTTAPTPISFNVSQNGEEFTIEFDESLNDSIIPDAARFSHSTKSFVGPVTIEDGSGADTVVRISGITEPFFDGEAGGTLSYVAAANPLQDAAGNEVATWADEAVTNNSTAARGGVGKLLMSFGFGFGF